MRLPIGQMNSEPLAATPSHVAPTSSQLLVYVFLSITPEWLQDPQHSAMDARLNFQDLRLEHRHTLQTD